MRNDGLIHETDEQELDEMAFVAQQGDDADFGEDLLSPAEFPAENELEAAPAPDEEAPAKTEKPSKPRSRSKAKGKKESTESAPAEASAQTGKRGASPVVSETDNTNVLTGFMREAASLDHMEARDARQADATAKAKLNAALSLGRPLEGMIAGVETVDREVYWVIYEGAVTIRIPAKESFMVVPEVLLANNKPSTLERQRQFLAKAIGARIRYVVTSYGVDPDGTDIYYASRTQALAIERRRYFGPNAPMPVAVGQDVYGHIISLGPHSAYICCCGLDIKVENHALSHRYIEDVSSDFYVGQDIKVRIMEINEEPGKRPVMKVSARIVELDKFRRNLKRVHENSRFIGTVTSIRVEHKADGTRVVVSLFLDGVELPAFSRTMTLRMRDELKTGDKVQFECYGYTANGYVHGSIIRYIRSR